jgi:hypothetical protein
MSSGILRRSMSWSLELASGNLPGCVRQGGPSFSKRQKFIERDNVAGFQFTIALGCNQNTTHALNPSKAIRFSVEQFACVK